MTYLIFKIVVFLAVATALGGGLGWYIRHILARRDLDEMNRTMREAQSLVPKLETNIVSRDQRIEKLKRDVGKWQEKYPALAKKLDDREATLRERDRSIHQLESQLAVARLSGAADDAADPLENAVAPQSAEDEQRFAALAEELEDQQQRFKDLVRVMDDQTQRIELLTLERERQEKTLITLNQQLEMAQQTNANLANNLQHSRDALRDAKSESEQSRANDQDPLESPDTKMKPELESAAAETPAPDASAAPGPTTRRAAAPAKATSPMPTEADSADEPSAVPSAQQPAAPNVPRPRFSPPSQPPLKRRKLSPSPRVVRGHRG